MNLIPLEEFLPSQSTMFMINLTNNRVGWRIDWFVERFGFRFLCFSPYRNPPEELIHMKNNKAVLHLPDMVGGMRCMYCGRVKKLHRSSKIKQSVV